MRNGSHFRAGFHITAHTRWALLLALALSFSSCALFHPKHKEGAATATTAGDVNIQFVGVTAFTTSDLNDALFDAFDEIKAEGLKDATADDLAFFSRALLP